MPVDGLYVGRQQHVPLVRRKRVPTKSLVCRAKGADARGDGIHRFAGSVGVLYYGTSSIGPLEACVVLSVVHGTDAAHALFSELSAVPYELVAQQFKREVLSTQWGGCNEHQVTSQCPTVAKIVLHVFLVVSYCVEQDKKSTPPQDY